MRLHTIIKDCERAIAWNLSSTFGFYSQRRVIYIHAIFSLITSKKAKADYNLQDVCMFTFLIGCQLVVDGKVA
jgi:hypothetical protein